MEVVVKKLMLLVVIAGCLFTAVARAQEVAGAQEDVRAQLAGQLLGLMDVEKNLQQSLDMVKKMQMEQIKNMVPTGQDASKAQEMQTKIMNLVASEMSWEKLSRDYTAIYAETFTEEELRGMVEFYQSPVGRKLIEKTPELMRRSMMVTQKQMADLMPKVQAAAREAQQGSLAPAPVAPAVGP